MRKAMQAALDFARVEPSDVDWVNAHGTGTRASDAAEASALRALFGKHPPIVSGSKGALATLTKNVANSMLDHRIRVNGINLGWTATPAEHLIIQRSGQGGPDWLEKAEAERPFGRLIQPAEVARLIAFLASPESGVMTGALIDYDQQVVGINRVAPKPEI